jgi:hypothetical protein
VRAQAAGDALVVVGVPNFTSSLARATAVRTLRAVCNMNRVSYNMRALTLLSGPSIRIQEHVSTAMCFSLGQHK